MKDACNIHHIVTFTVSCSYMCMYVFKLEEETGLCNSYMHLRVFCKAICDY